MREKTYYEHQLSLLAGTEGTLEAARAKQQEIDSLLNGRMPKNLSSADRQTYDNLVYELNDILRKRELQQIVDNYDELQAAVTSEEALDEELARIDEIINFRESTGQGGNTEKARTEASGARTSDSGKRYTAPTAIQEVDLTVEAGQQVINETIERAKAVIRMNQKGRTEYSGSGIAASKQVATLRALLESSRPLTREQRDTIRGMVRAFENIIDKEYDIEAQRKAREEEGQEQDEEIVTEKEIEVVRKEQIRSKIAEQEKLRELAQIRIRAMEIRSRQDDPNTPEEERVSLENERASLQARTEELLGIGNGNPSGPDVNAQRTKLTEAERAALEEERTRIRKEAQEEIDYADDVIPVLQELEQLPSVPNLEFDAIYASDVDKMLEKYRKELEELEAQRKNHDFDGKSDEDLEKRLKEIEEEIQDEYNFRAHQENGMEEHEDDKLQRLLDEKKRLQDEQKRRKENPDKDDDKDLDRKIKRLKNIIKELESLEREKVKIREVTKKKKKRKTHPKPKPIPDPGREPKPHDPDPKPKQKLPRHWVEIMADMQTESSGSIPMYFHNMGKVQPFKMGLTIWAAPIKIVMKGAGKLLGDGLGRVNSKKNKMRENLIKLAQENPEEFEILVRGLTETNMRQYKVNEAFLDVVQEVLEAREAPKKQAAIEADNAIKSALATEEQEIDRLKRQLDDPSLTADRKIALQQQLQTHSLVFNTLMIEHAKQYAIQEDVDRRLQDFERGKQAKSTRKMNIQGWLAGSFNPDNRDVHKQEAEYRKTMREAAEAGDTATVADMQRKIDELQQENTHEIKLLQGTRFANRARISRGKHKVEEVHQRTSDADQTKGRELIATIMVGASIANLYQRWQANQQVQQQVNNHLAQHNQQVRTTNAHNQQVQQSITSTNAHNQMVQKNIDSVNAHNQGVNQEIMQANQHNQGVGQQISSAQGQVSSQQLQDAGITEIHRNNAATYSVRHEAEFVRDNTPGVGFNHGGSDDAIHAAQPGMTASRTAAESGSMADVSREAAQSAQRAQQAAQQVLPDVQPFTTIPGKGIFVNSEYIENLQHIAGGGTSSFTLLEKLFKSVQGMDQPQLVVGQAQDVTQTVQMVSGTVQDVAEIPGLVLTMPAGSMVNWLPLVASIVNVGHLEQQKAERTAAERARERAERAKAKQEKQADRTPSENQPEEQDNDEHDL